MFNPAISPFWREPRWRVWTRKLQPLLPAAQRDWLLDTGSLTQHLLARCPKQFRVVLRRQSWGYPQPAERRRLRMRPGSIALIREVELCCAKQVWVFARTLIPARSLRGRTRRLAHLGNRPLGALLFADPRTRRAAVEIALLQSQHRLFQTAATCITQQPTRLWGRRTLFHLAGRPLLVNEVFLPELPAR